MMTCREFRDHFAPGTDDMRLLEHVRSCDACLDFAAHVDPDIMFRAIGGAEMVPPGGVDVFVEDVMRQVRVRSAANVVSIHPRWSWRRLSAAAAIVVAVTTGALMYQHRGVAPVVNPVPIPAPIAANLTTKPVVETYDSDKATIVEVPVADNNNTEVVMIFDESLPSNL